MGLRVTLFKMTHKKESGSRNNHSLCPGQATLLCEIQKKTRLELSKVGTKMYVVKSSLTRDAGPQGAVEWGWGWEGMGIGEVAYFPRM